ncbi:MAG TPA: hypothetical protein VH394_29845 [Thermoanaerobaculia bacterium]|nr:hypothetical protein [Thermoanaerobaculia bacterium]
MSTKRSIAGILGDLESEISRLEKEEAFHAQQEAAHREKRAASAAKLALVRERYEAFRSASAAVEEVAPASAASVEGSKAPTSVIRHVARIVASKAADEPFTPSELLAELSQRSPKLAASNRNVSAALRRLVKEGGVRVVEEGKPYHEAVYARGVRKKKGTATA